jgi:hypothetical protein
MTVGFGVLNTTLCGLCSSGASTNKTDRQGVTEILLKVVLKQQYS